MNEARYRAAEQRLWESVGLAPTERRLVLERTGATVRAQEVGTGPPVVFVHGASNSGVSWAELVARIEGFRCILLDRPGCGLSGPPSARLSDPAALEEFADAMVVDVLDALGLDTAHVVATSYGGYFALHTAARHPERLDRMVVFGFTLGAPVSRTPFAMRLTSIPGLGHVFASIPPNERAVRMILRQVGLGNALDDGRFTQVALDSYVSLLRDTDTMRNEVVYGPRIVTPLRGMNSSVLFPADVLAAITTPALFLWGDEDPIAGADVARPFVAQLPHAALELVPGAGHAAWIDEPKITATRTAAFLAAGH